MLAAIASVILGVWLAISPAALAYSGPARTTAHLIGPLVATFAAIAISQVTRQARLANAPLGAWLVIAPLLLGYSALAALNSVAVGLLVTGLSFSRGRSRHQQGGGWAALLGTPK